MKIKKNIYVYIFLYKEIYRITVINLPSMDNFSVIEKNNINEINNGNKRKKWVIISNIKEVKNINIKKRDMLKKNMKKNTMLALLLFYVMLPDTISIQFLIQ